MNIAKHLTDLVGNTPLLQLSGYADDMNTGCRILAKLECFNPLSSTKDRVALSMLDDALERGALAPGSVIIEPTSGNTGVGLAFVAASRGYRLILTMPDTMSLERRSLLKALGAQLVLTDGKKGMRGAIDRAQELAAETPGAWIPGQFTNPANPAVHQRTTAQEIWNDTQGAVDAFVSAVGTGGTITGTGRGLREHKPNIRIVGVEPAASPVLSGGKAGAHKIQGIGAGFVPDILDRSVIDEIITVTDEEAFASTRLLARREGLLVGISSGAAAFAAAMLSQRPEYAGKTIVVLLPDTGERYLSTGVFD